MFQRILFACTAQCHSRRFVLALQEPDFGTIVWPHTYGDSSMSRRASKRAGPRRAKKPSADHSRPESEVPSVPPPEAQTADAGSPAFAAAEPTLQTQSAQPTAVEPPPAIPSGIVPGPPNAAERDHEDELAEFMVKLRPYYRETDRRPSERAPALEVEDLSLRLDNPYLPSSLVPPPRPPLVVPAAVLGIAGAAVVAIVAGGGAWLLLSGARTSSSAAELPLARAQTAERPARSPEAEAATNPSVERSAAPEFTAGVPPAPPVGAELQEADKARANAVRETASAAPTPPVLGTTLSAKTSGSPSARAGLALPGEKPLPATSPRRTASRPSVRAPAPPAVSSLEPLAPPEPSVEAQPESPPMVAGPLPRLPAPRAVKLAFEKIHTPLAECAAGKHGLLTIHATINNEGRIVSAFVDGVFKSPEEHSCMARAILTARFPAFSQSSFKVSYPLAL